MSLLYTAGESLKGVGLSLFGSWLLVICVGGLLTLGVLSSLYLGILLSLGAIGLLLVIGGCCVLHQVMTASPQSEKEDRHTDFATRVNLPLNRYTPTPSVRSRLKREVIHQREEAEETDEDDRFSAHSSFRSKKK